MQSVTHSDSSEIKGPTYPTDYIGIGLYTVSALTASVALLAIGLVALTFGTPVLSSFTAVGIILSVTMPILTIMTLFLAHAMHQTFKGFIEVEYSKTLENIEEKQKWMNLAAGKYCQEAIDAQWDYSRGVLLQAAQEPDEARSEELFNQAIDLHHLSQLNRCFRLDFSSVRQSEMDALKDSVIKNRETLKQDFQTYKSGNMTQDDFLRKMTNYGNAGWRNVTSSAIGWAVVPEWGNFNTKWGQAGNS